MKRSSLAPIALVIGLFGASQAHAGDITFDNFANGYESVNISVSAPNAALNEFAAAGGLHGAYNGGTSFTSYCVDVYDDAYFNTAMTGYTPVTGSAHVFANANANVDIGKLYAENNVVNSAVSQAAFQIAVWEIAYETTGHYDVTSGSAQFSGGTAATSGALTLAGSWLAELPSVKNGVQLTVFQDVATGGNEKYQDQVTAAVPEPSTYALMAAGLLSIGFIGRRRGMSQR